MSYMTGLIGTCQQLKDASSGGGGSAPTNVSVATSSSGNYNNSFSTFDTSAMALTSAGSSSSVSVSKSQYDEEHGVNSSASFYVHAYLRATGGTSYAMTAALTGNSNLSAGSVAISGNSTKTQQDNTSSTGLGTVTITHGGGRGGIVTPSVGDEVQVKVNGSATNSNGTTNATQIVHTLQWGS